MLPETVETYLSRFALKGWEIESAGLENLTTIIVIPAIREYNNIRELLLSLSACDDQYFSSTLALFVINNSQLSSGTIKEDNNNSISLLNAIINHGFSKNDDLISNVCKSGLRVGYIDASSAGKELPPKDAGVGLARKIGMDLSLIALDYNQQCKKILVCLDADCTVNKNYITGIVEGFNSSGLSAAVVNYLHNADADSEVQDAIICYEIFLRYYELGLLYAQSPFAFPTIGSTMACDFETYIKTEGMNKRKAAEDFYFLEKIAKNYKIEKIKTATVYPSSRRSWRVPFGTGQRVNRFLAGVQNEYLLYNPESFRILKKWLKVFNYETNISVDELLDYAKGIDESLYTFLLNQKFDTDWQKVISNSKTEEQLQRQKVKWFDGFRTLKLIHYLKDYGYPPVNMFEALNVLFNEFNLELPAEIKLTGYIPVDYIPALDIREKYLDVIRSFLQSK